MVPHLVTPMREVLPLSIKRPEYAETGEPKTITSKARIYKPEEIVKARASARLARQMLEFACSLALSPGISTDEIDRLTHEEICRHGAYPSPINYRGFPKAICTSVNEVVCHGIPDKRPLEHGDIVSIDVSVYFNGFHGDNCGTVICGDNSIAAASAGAVGTEGGGEEVEDAKGRELVRATKEALDAAIAICGPGVCFSAVGEAIQLVAANRDFRIIHEFCGHGTGEYLHMPPFVRHHRNTDRLPMQVGMIFTIEPIFVEGGRKITVWEDGWSAVTVDGGRGAQFEHEVLITEHGHEVITVL